MTIQEQRRKAFEEWLDSAGFEVRRYHHIPGYHGNEQMAAWEAWNAALDSVCVTLPGLESWNDDERHIAIAECREAIHAAGVKTK